MAPGILRVDRLTGRTVFLCPPAPGKPYPPAGALQPEIVGPCPFCAPTCYLRTPDERARRGTGAANTDGWTTRSFTNGWPLVAAPPRGPAFHEIVVLSPDHDRHFADMDSDEATGAIGLILDRARAYLDAGRHLAVFMNYGRLAGATQAHPHAQVLGLDDALPYLAVEAAATRPGDCFICAEMADPALSVAHGAVSIWCPWASRAWEVRIAGRAHESWPSDPGALAAAVCRTLRSLRAALGPHAYVLVFHLEGGHWHVHVLPRLGIDSGISDASGLTLTTDRPERTAPELRAQL